MEKLKLPLNYATMAALASFCLFIVAYLSFSNPLQYAAYLMFWVPIVGIIFSMKKYRDDENGGFATYGEMLRTGIVFTLVYASMYAILFFIFNYFIDTSLIEKFKENSLAEIEKAQEQLSGTMASFMDKAMEEIEKLDIQKLSFNEFINRFIWGLIISLIAAAFIRKSEGIFD
jgi:mannose/fructose/N-acetylgalactosamine-specific phosphotransferase system component IIC